MDSFYNSCPSNITYYVQCYKEAFYGKTYKNHSKLTEMIKLEKQFSLHRLPQKLVQARVYTAINLDKKYLWCFRCQSMNIKLILL